MSILSIRDEERLQNLEARLEELKKELSAAEKAMEADPKGEFLIQINELERLITQIKDEINEIVLR